MVKLLISGKAGTGKTTLLKSLGEDSLIIAVDGKKYPFNQPHFNVMEASVMKTFIADVEAVVEKYVKAKGELPKVIVFDSVSKIASDIEMYSSANFKGFEEHTNNKSEIGKFAKFVEKINRKVDVVLVSHSTEDPTTGDHDLVGIGGNFKKRSGFYAEVNEAITITGTGKVRKVNFKYRPLARTLLEDIEESVNANDFNLNDHLNRLRAQSSEASKFEITL